MWVQLMCPDCSIHYQVLNDVLAFHDRFVCGFGSNGPIVRKKANGFEFWKFSNFVGIFDSPEPLAVYYR